MKLIHPPTAMYVITRPKFGGLVAHDAILRETWFGSQVIELHPLSGLRVRPLEDLSDDEGFHIIESVDPAALPTADARLMGLLQEPPTYFLTSRNCQHFACYVATGRWHSRGWEAAKTVGTVAIGAWLLGSILLPARN